ncbi:hypothetical protein PLESTM_000843000 [Pleodorina starrii]|nr:hypothetical protein PLESTM_000843000 [Pleodorina starrii]
MQSVNKDLHSDDCGAKLKAMSDTPFTFYRGSNLIYYRDMAEQGTVLKSAFYDPKATPWIQGDMHVLNAGRFANDKGTVVYDLNDFDEAFVANFLYDVYRLATSIVLVARNNSMVDDDATSCVKTFAKAYRDQLKLLAEDPKAKPFTYDNDNSPKGLIRDLLKDTKGPEAMRQKMLKKWSLVDPDTKTRRFHTEDNKDLAPVSGSDRAAIEAAVVDYYMHTVTSRLHKNKEYFQVVDVALRKNAGTGSLGTSRYYVLIAGESREDPEDDVILDVKLQGKPCVYKYLSREQQAAVDGHVDNDADRAVRAYKSLLRRSDDHLGYMNIKGLNYSVRERSPYKKALSLTSDLTVADLDSLAEQYGILLANAHARSDKDNEDLGVPESFGQLVTDLTRSQRGEFAAEVADVALSYAIQVEHDYALFRNSMSLGNNRLC